MIDPTPMRASLEEIRYHARMILRHPKECEYWTGHGCEVSMLHDAEDIDKLVDDLLKLIDLDAAATPGT